MRKRPSRFRRAAGWAGTTRRRRSPPGRAQLAGHAFATLFAFTLGFVQQQLLSSAPGSLARRQTVLERLPLDDFDNLSRIGAVFLLRSSDRHFEDGLDLIIRGLETKTRT